MGYLRCCRHQLRERCHRQLLLLQRERATESFAAGLAVAAETAIGVARRPAAAIEAMAIFTVFIVGLLKLECEREFTWLYWPESLIKSTPLGDRLPILSVAAHNSTKNREIFCETRHVYRQEIPRIRLK
jgi:hypothetical protein